MELHALADEFMCANDDVDLAVRQVLQQFSGLFGRARTREVVNAHGQVFQSVAEGLVVLVGQHRGGHEDGHLLRVAGRLEGCTHGHLGLAEADIAAHEAIHRARLLHVGLDVVGGLQLVGRVLIEE